MTRGPADYSMRPRVWSAGAVLAALCPVALLAACGSGSERGPGGVSEGEAAALDEGAEMLDKQQIPEGAIPPIEAPTAAPAAQSSKAQSVPAEATD